MQLEFETGILKFIPMFSKSSKCIGGLVASLTALVVMANAQSEIKKTIAPETSARQERLQQLVNDTVQFTMDRFADQKLATNQLAVTLVDLRTPQAPVQASYRGDAQIYPASVVKLFYFVAAHRWMEDGKLQDTEELRRAMRDM